MPTKPASVLCNPKKKRFHSALESITQSARVGEL